jgi:hypothetical protein
VAEAAPEYLSADDADAVLTAVSEDSPLSSREQQMLALERQWWKYAGAKEQAIR